MPLPVDGTPPARVPIRAAVEARLERALSDEAAAARAARLLSWSRLGYVAAAGALLAVAGAWTWPWIAAAVLLFLPIARVHRRAEERARHARGMVAACRASLARIDRDWEAMPAARAAELPATGNRAAAHDLDVIGAMSLFRLLDVGLAAGGECILRWLLTDPAPVPVIVARQASTTALRERPDLLFESARIARFGAGRRPPPSRERMEAFRAWLTEPVRPLSRLVVQAARALTVVLLVVAIGAAIRPTLREPALLVATLVVPVQVVLAAIARRHLRRGLGTTADTLERMGAVVATMRIIAAAPPVEGRLGEIQRRLAGNRAVSAVAQLQRLLDWDAVRYSPLMHYAANGAVAFDAHLAERLDAWHVQHAAQVPEWIDLVAEAQALIALGTLAYENPGWVMPAVHDEETPVLEAASCGHPLLPAATRVTNPVTLSRPAETLVITGSNMSGKTTYLRAVGLDVLLALAGGPVCASAMTVRRVRVRSSVRVEDDLSRGSSLFFAEVTRIRDVVADAERAGPPVFFLLDEILHGTNAADRRAATHRVLDRLMRSGSTGIITTHDAGVGTGAGATLSQRHFTDAVRTVDGAVRMTFDYTLREGPATSTNALRILEMMGLGTD